MCRPLAGAEIQKPRTMARLECCVVTGLEPALRFSISIMPALPDKPVNALLYPSNPQAGIELHHNGKITEALGISRSQGWHCRNDLTCCDQKAPAVSQGLNFVMPEVAVLLSPYTPA